MERIRNIVTWWKAGLSDSAQLAADAHTIQEYEEECAAFGSDSVEARRLVAAVQEARGRINSAEATAPPA